MPTPDFVLDLRAQVGTHPLWLSGVTAVVLDATGENVLLIRRSDNGRWTPITGIVDPGEEPGVAAIREAQEEADVRIALEKLASVSVTKPVVYGNGDRAQYLDLTFRARYVDGDPFPADGEATEVRWYPVDALPEMTDEMLRRVADALDPGLATRFVS